MGKTQKELARLLCVSVKTIQSFEQGWRRIPIAFERQILLHLFWEKARDKPYKVCWEMQNCPTEWRDSCTAWQNKAGHVCWFINGTFCQGKYQENWSTKIKICQQCKVFKELMPKLN